jgi:Asp/Glu/hydantoin racemase
MKRIALVSVTLNAVNPMAELFSEQRDKFEVVHYLDEGLQLLVAQEGKVTDKSLPRLIAILGKAAGDGAGAILLTCSVFSPLVEKLQKLFSVPIISVDGAMLDTAAAMNKKTAIICTFPAAVQISLEMFRNGALNHKVQPKADAFLLEEAAKAVKRGDKAAHDKLIAEKALSLQDSYDLIVLAQISMTGAGAYLGSIKKPVLTSPESALQSLIKLVDSDTACPR